MIKITKIKNGYVRGSAAADPRIISYKGIPYAEPPVGENRWRAPQPCKDWNGIRECIEFSPISMQSIPGLDQENIYTKEWNVDSEIPMSEDSLYLNVWTPAQTAQDRLPVFFWIHGGALQWGNSAEMEFDGERLARRGIVVVTINYRLNVFGFFVHPDMIGDKQKGDLNMGNLDQQAALRWTKENISAFGGDPDRIIIGGQSAGGGSVLTQLNCEENRDYIQGAIVSSGIFGDPFKNEFSVTLEEAMESGKKFLEFLGVSSLEEARKLPAEYIRDKNDEYGKFWGTVVDGKFQTDTIFHNIEKKKFLDVPLLLGWTNNEFWTQAESENEKELMAEAQRVFGNEKKEQWLELLGLGSSQGADVGRSRINSVETGTRTFCEKEEENGYLCPKYVYEFGAEIPGEDDPGAFHSSDLWFFFESLAKCWRPFTGKHYDLARQMCNYWANFVKSGNPNGKDSTGQLMEEWDSFESFVSNVMYFYDTPEQKRKDVDEMQRFYIDYLKRGQ